MLKLLINIASLLIALVAASITDILPLEDQSDIPEDAHLNFSQLANKYGRECEDFDVQTEDGYILKLFHIKGNKCQTPLLMMHGLLDSADGFIISGNKSIALDLTEAGYDVWVGNSRGNKYSRRHVTLSPTKNKEAFWDFSPHEKGTRDLPAIIDFILQKTSKTKLAVIGHSQGTTEMYVLGSEKPEYNEKISVFISLAPVAYLRDVGLGISTLIKLWPVLNDFFKSLGYEGVLQDKGAATEVFQFICTQGQLGYDVCDKGIFSIFAGADSEEMDPEFFKVLLSHFPAGTSRKDFSFYVHIAKSDCFAQFDYGEEKNLLIYDSPSPPAYNLTKVTMPIVLVAGKNDQIAGLKDVERLNNELPNVVQYHVMKREKFNHADFLYGKHINEYMTPLLRNLLCKFAQR